MIRLNGKQLRRLRTALLATYVTEEDLSILVQDLDRALPQISTGANLTVMMNATIKVAQNEGWLLDLLTMVSNDNPNAEEFAALLQELQAQTPPAAIDPYNVCRLGGDMVMVDRETLRSTIRKMASPLGKRILVIDGQPKSGKSHAKYLVTYLRQAMEGFEVVLVDLERDASALQRAIQAEDLGGRIADQMRVALPPPPEDHQRATWVLKFCDNLVARAIEARAQGDTRGWWIVIDHFNKVLLRQPTLDLVKELAHRVATTLSDYRLILISYGDEFSADVAGFVARDAMTPIKPEDLIRYFHCAFQEIGQEPDAERVALAVADVLRTVDLNSPDCLPLLAAEVVKTTDQIMAGN